MTYLSTQGAILLVKVLGTLTCTKIKYKFTCTRFNFVLKSCFLWYGGCILFLICDPFCQNETLLCTWSKLSFWCIIKVYILPFIMVVKIWNQTILSEVMPIWPLGIEKYEMEKPAFKVCGLSLRQLPSGPEIIKITSFMIQFSILNFHSIFKTHKQLWFYHNLKIKIKKKKKWPPQVFSAISPFEVLHRSIVGNPCFRKGGFWRLVKSQKGWV